MSAVVPSTASLPRAPAQPGVVLAGGGAMGDAVRAHDWSATPLGPLHAWPASLRAAAELVLNSRQPMYLVWGPALTSLFNDAFVPLLAGRSEGALGRSFPDLWADVWEAVEPLVRSALGGTPTWSQDLPLLLRRGEREELAFFTFSYSPVRDEGGAVAGLLNVAAETTQTVRATAELRASERRFRTLAEALPNPVWTAGRDGRLDWMNQQALVMNDRTMDEVAGAGWANLVHPDDQAHVQQAWADSVGTGRPYEVEFRVLRADGAYRWNLVRAMPLVEDGRVVQWVGTNTDIEDQKLAQGRLREMNAALASSVQERTVERDNLWALSQDAFLISDGGGQWRSVSPGWEPILGWRPEELLGQTSHWIVHPDDAEPTQAAVRQLSAGHAISRFENRLRARDGSFRLMSWKANHRDGRNYCIARDVTEERARATALERTREELRQSQKMEAVGQLTGGIAHDFNNLLTGIIGSLDLVRRRLGEGRTDGLLRSMDRATASAQKAAALTHRLLAFSRRQTLDSRPNDVNALVTSMQDLLARTLGRHVQLEVALQPDLWTAFTDAHQLENALLNLAINARDAMPEGGRLHIATANAAAVDAPGAPGGNHVRITVADTGTGMDEHTLAHAFEPFFTTKPAGKGTGLGLSMIYGFVKQSNGHLHLSSVPGGGTTATIWLPRHDGPLLAEAEAETGHSAISGGGEAILLVEDDDVVRALAAEALGELGYRVLAVADGPAALAALEGAGTLDLMVSDVGLPGMGGRELADAVRRQRPDLPVLFVTGYAEGATVRSGFLGPGMDLLSKPFTLDALAAKVRGMLATRAFVLL